MKWSSPQQSPPENCSIDTPWIKANMIIIMTADHIPYAGSTDAIAILNQTLSAPAWKEDNEAEWVMLLSALEAALREACRWKTSGPLDKHCRRLEGWDAESIEHIKMTYRDGDMAVGDDSRRAPQEDDGIDVEDKEEEFSGGQKESRKASAEVEKLVEGTQDSGL
ncbi:MAG: hypothetical protein Q9160_007103 [Pyrenula sp. 1 TL-2023]